MDETQIHTTYILRGTEKSNETFKQLSVYEEVELSESLIENILHLQI